MVFSCFNFFPLFSKYPTDINICKRISRIFVHFQITLIPFYVLEMTHLRSIFVIRKDGFCTYAQFLHVLGSAQQNSIHVSRAHVAPCRHFDALNQDGFSLTKFALLESHFLLLHIFFTFLDDDDRNQFCWHQMSNWLSQNLDLTPLLSQVFRITHKTFFCLSWPFFQGLRSVFCENRRSTFLLLWLLFTWANKCVTKNMKEKLFKLWTKNLYSMISVILFKVNQIS